MRDWVHALWEAFLFSTSITLCIYVLVRHLIP